MSAGSEFHTVGAAMRKLRAPKLKLLAMVSSQAKIVLPETVGAEL